MFVTSHVYLLVHWYFENVYFSQNNNTKMRLNSFKAKKRYTSATEEMDWQKSVNEKVT